jgi:hypothetical protein
MLVCLRSSAMRSEPEYARAGLFSGDYRPDVISCQLVSVLVTCQVSRGVLICYVEEAVQGAQGAGPSPFCLNDGGSVAIEQAKVGDW